MMSEWKEFELKELVTFSQGIQVPVDRQHLSNSPSRGRFIRIVDYTKSNEPPRYIENVSERYGVNVDDVVMIRYGSRTAGKVVRGIKGYLANNLFKITILDENILSKDYLFYFLSKEKIYSYLMKTQSSSAMPAITFRDLNQIKIQVPSLEKQKKIIYDFEQATKKIETYTKKIELNTQINQTLEQIAQAMFKSWFIDFDPVRAKIAALAQGDDPDIAAMTALSGKSKAELQTLKTTNLERYQQLQQLAAALPSELVEIDGVEVPRGWRVGTLSDICSMQNGYAFKSSEWKERGLPVIKIGSVKPMIIEVYGNGFVAEDYQHSKSDFVVRTGDILIGLTGNYVGEVGRMPNNQIAMLNQRVAKFIPYKINQDLDYYCLIYCLSRRIEFKKNVEIYAKGSAQVNISTRDILNYQIVIPQQKINICFEKMIKPMLDEILINSSNVEMLSNTRDLLINKILAG
ncbi:restriction endonuclease subunit S [Testudinibacter sp. P27/CKL/0425]